jgi:transcriptional regulator of acetoin/glycerol metabolism
VRQIDMEDLILTLEQVECLAIKRALKITKGNISKSARTLGVSRTCLYIKMKRHNLFGGVQYSTMIPKEIKG